MNPIIYIILAIILVVVLYYVYVYWKPNPVLVKTVDLTKSEIDPIQYSHSNFMPNGTSGSTNIRNISYTYSIWIYVDSLQKSGVDQTLFTFCNEANDKKFFRLYLDDQDTATLKVDIGTSPSKGAYDTKYIIINPSFPLQRWTNVIVSIDTNFIDIYQDGKLALSSAITSPIYMPDTNSFIKFGSLTGHKQEVILGNFMRFPYPIDPATAYSIYTQGNGQPGAGGVSIHLWNKVGENGIKNNIFG